MGTHQFFARARSQGTTTGFTSNLISVEVTAGSVNHAPAASHDALVVAEDTAGSIDVTANDSDLDGDPLSVLTITQPAHGVATRSGNVVTYTPAGDYHGGDQLEYTVGDGRGGISAASVFVTVTPVNDAPIAIDDALLAVEDDAGAVDVLANDGDPDGGAAPVVTGYTQPAHGAVVLVGGLATYAPVADFNGSDAFTYTIQDSAGASATATVNVTVAPANDAPVAAADVGTLDEGAALTLDVVANDSDLDLDELTVIAVSAPSHGTATIADAHHIAYVPAAHYHGDDALTYTISDGHGGTATAAVALTILNVNDPPVAVADAASVAEDGSVTVDVVANDTDPDNDALTISAITQPAHGTATIVDAHRVAYAPAADYQGGDALTYTIVDGDGEPSTATLSLTVTPVNDAPVAASDSATLDEDGEASIDVVANDHDLDGDALVVSAITAPAHGVAMIIDAHHIAYLPAANYHGGDALSYTIDDGAGGTATATLTLTIAPVNDAPVVTSTAASTFDDTAVAIALTASDVEGDPVTWTIASAPAHGTLGALVGDHVTYTPAAGYVGGDAFDVMVSDGAAASTATVAIAVIASVCGNGVREGREQCDDGNAAGGDGCEPTCRLTCGADTGADRAIVDAASGHCYAGYDGASYSYQQAAALCRGAGGHLATIASAGEDAAAFAAVLAGDAPWLGADDLAIEGSFHWLTGEAIGYSHFATGKPDDAGGADCMRYAAAGEWSDAACASTSGALCEFELVAATPVIASAARATALADFDGDGFVDAAIVHEVAGTVEIRRGNGAGGFTTTSTVTVEAGPVAIAAADLDADGALDLAVVSAGANKVSALHGAGNGSFAIASTTPIATGGKGIAIADFDGDGKLDFAIASNGPVRILHGTASGYVEIGYALPGGPSAIAAGDLDGNGTIDLAVTTPGGAWLSLNAGGGSFGAATSLASLTNARGVAVADLDVDGRLDVVAASSAGLTVWFGGAWSTPVVLATPAPASGVAIGDVNGDGARDVIAVVGGFATWFAGSSSRSLGTARPAVAAGDGGAAVGDVDGDGAADLVVAGALVFGSGDGLVGARAVPAGTSTTTSVAADFNGDGRVDLAVADPQEARIYVFVQSSTGVLAPRATIQLVVGAQPTYLGAADFDGDGFVDLAVTSVAYSNFNMMTGNGNGTFDAPLNVSVAQSPRRFAIADFNGDGKPDVAVASALGNAVTILRNTGVGFARSDLALGNAPVAVAAGDFDGDGAQDLAVATSGGASVQVLLGHNNATFATPVGYAVAASASAIAAADLDGDGALDLVATHPSTSNVSVLYGASGSFAAATPIAVGAAAATSIAIADLDGDGGRDLVVGHAGGASVLHASPAGYVASSYAAGAALGVTVADIDGDGHRDVVLTTGSGFATVLRAAR